MAGSRCYLLQNLLTLEDNGCIMLIHLLKTFLLSTTCNPTWSSREAVVHRSLRCTSRKIVVRKPLRKNQHCTTYTHLPLIWMSSFLVGNFCKWMDLRRLFDC